MPTALCHVCPRKCALATLYLRIATCAGVEPHPEPSHLVRGGDLHPSFVGRKVKSKVTRELASKPEEDPACEEHNTPALAGEY